MEWCWARIVELVLVVSNKHYDHGHTNQFSRGDLWCRVGEGDLCSVLINSPGIEYFWLWSLNRLCLWSKSWLMETLGRLGVGGLWCVSLLIKVLCALSDAWDWGNGFSSVNGVICFGSSLFNPGVVVDWFILVVSFNSVVYAWLLSGSGWWIWWWFVDYFLLLGVLVMWLWFIG